MSALLDLYIKEDILETLLKVIQKKGEKGISLTISVSDETNQFGQNISSFVSQSKDQIESKKEKYYVGNGKVFWTNGSISVAKKKEEQKVNQQPTVEDDLPF
ncbi:MAG: hypothetical protein ACRCXZ_02520 [Patescibacteria group bacterium]